MQGVALPICPHTLAAVDQHRRRPSHHPPSMVRTQPHLVPGEILVNPSAYFLKIASNCECLHGALSQQYLLSLDRWLELAVSALEAAGATVYFDSGSSVYFGILHVSVEEGEIRARGVYESLAKKMEEHIDLWASWKGSSKDADVLRDPLAHRGTERMRVAYRATQFECIAHSNYSPTSKPCYLPCAPIDPCEGKVPSAD